MPSMSEHEIRLQLQRALDDPMWPQHAEVSKELLRGLAGLLHQLQARALTLEDKDLHIEAARWRYLEEHAVTHGGGNGFEVKCWIPVDHEDMGCGVDAAIALEQGKGEQNG